MELNLSSTRRSFIKRCVIGGVAVYSAPLLAKMGSVESSILSPELLREWHDGETPKFRLDGVAKVTGEKIYGRDYRAIDMPGWPDQQGYGFILRASDATHVFTGIDLSSLPANAQPSKVITADDLRKDSIELPVFFGADMLLSEGQTAHYFGHAVAILLFDDFPAYKKAKSMLEFGLNVVQYGKETPYFSASSDPQSSWRIIRVEGDNPNDEDKYSPLQDGIFFPNYKAHKAIWPTLKNVNGDVSERGMYYANEINNEITEHKKNEDWLVLEKEYTTQIIEPMMLEPEAFNGWFDPKEGTFHTVITSQSPQDFQEQAVHMLASSPLKGKVKHLVVHSPFIGGGFGAKDHSIFPYYGLVAAMYSDKPIHVANNRFEQFQSGLKRHPFKMNNRLAVDKKTLKIQALKSDIDVDGGGRVNFTGSVTMVGATGMQGIYYIPKNDIKAVAHASANPTSGSMRGYGTLQSMATMESMMNEMASDLGVDAIKLRQANVMVSGQRNTQGAIPNGALRYQEILESAINHPIWVNQAAAKQNFDAQNPGKKYGVGFGIVTKDYGTGAAAPSAAVFLTKEGKIEVDICSMEMGTGTQTSQAEVVSDELGRRASVVRLAETDIWDALEQFQTYNPYFISQEQQDEMTPDPRWTPVKGMASSASMSAFYQTHATRLAANVIYEHALWPAAVAIWKKNFFNSSYANTNLDDSSAGEWTEGKLSAAGYPALPLSMLAEYAHQNGLVTGAMVHAFNRWAWADADFEVLGNSIHIEADGLAVQYGEGASKERKALMGSNGFHLLTRSNMFYPKAELNNAMVTYYAPCATIVEVSVNESTGEVDILNSHTWLEAGKVIVNELVEGQIQGGLAMGIGHALYEELPPLEEGAGNGTWNLNRYHVPKAKQVGVWNQSHTILPPLSKTDPSKGIGEVVMIPIVPALVEAVYQATNVRFYDLPMTAMKIKGALNDS